MPQATLPRMAMAEERSAETAHPVTMTQVAGLASTGFRAATVAWAEKPLCVAVPKRSESNAPAAPVAAAGSGSIP